MREFDKTLQLFSQEYFGEDFIVEDKQQLSNEDVIASIITIHQQMETAPTINEGCNLGKIVEQTLLDSAINKVDNNSEAYQILVSAYKTFNN